MSHSIEDRLRDAYQAKTAQLTEQRLDQFAAAREHGMEDLLGVEHTVELPALDFESGRARKRPHRWIAPALAAAAVAALAIGVTTVTGIAHESKPKPVPPASHVSSPPPSSSAPTPSASASQQTVVAPPYLPAGQTGSRDQVPWSVVGSGWRLLQPGNNDGYGDTLYLYDPAGGRYLITDQLPAHAYLQAWSPDGNRAMVRTHGITDPTRWQEVDLRTGTVSAGFEGGDFITYTQPRGLAVVMGPSPLFRFSHDGTVEHRYPATVPGLGKLGDSVLYLPDGTEFVGNIFQGPAALFGNDGHLVRTYPEPSGYLGCTPAKWWSPGTFLEFCERAERLAPVDALYLQPVAGGSPELLTDNAGATQMGHWNGWPLSNGDVLLANTSGCGSGGYQVLGSDGTVRDLQLPVGVPAPGALLDMHGDWATFVQTAQYSCGQQLSQRRLIDYNLVTKQTRPLIDGTAILVNWPGDPS